MEDCIGLGRGITACPRLKKFTLTRSNLDQPRVAALLQGMVQNDSVGICNFPIFYFLILIFQFSNNP